MINIERFLTYQFIRFFVVGTSAALVHFLACLILVDTVGLTPPPANMVSFLIAFVISFLGHRHWTYRAYTTTSYMTSMKRFFAVACGGFCLNNALFYGFYQFLDMHYLVALTVVLILVAFITFFASRLWAFAA
jgi:putative flippase GtrA